LRTLRSTDGRPDPSANATTQAEALTVPLDDGGRIDQHHRVQTTRPQSVEPDPEQAVKRKQPEPTRPLATQNVQLVTESEVLQLQNNPTTESAGNNPWNA
jgi:hypothetical protein